MAIKSLILSMYRRYHLTHVIELLVLTETHFVFPLKTKKKYRYRMATLSVYYVQVLKIHKNVLLSHARDKFQLFIFELDTRSLHKLKVKMTYIFQLYSSSVRMKMVFLCKLK